MLGQNHRQRIIMVSNIQKLSVRSLVPLILILGSCGLAVIDKEFRPTFGDIVLFELGAYTGQIIHK